MRQLHRGALAGSEGLLVTVKRCPAPPDKPGSFLSGAALGPRVLGDIELIEGLLLQ